MAPTHPQIAEVAASLIRRMDQVSAGMADQIRRELRFYQQDVVPYQALQESCQRNSEVVLGSFLGSGPLDLEPARQTGRERATQGAPLAELLQAYRIGFAYLWDELVTAAGGVAEVTSEMLVDVAADLWRLAGEYTDAAAAAYRETSAHLMMQREHERSVLVEALFSGVIPDQGSLWEAAALLRLPVEGRFMVVAAESPALGREALAGIESRLAADGVTSAWRLLPDQQIGVLSVRSAAADEPVVEILRHRAVSRVGVSTPYASLHDTPQALRHARLAMAGLPAGKPEVAVFDDAPIARLVAAAPAEAERIARAVLGPVLDLPHDDRGTLLRTLREWFATAGSAAETARRLYCHPNTIRYRLRRLEELTGRSLHAPGALAELSIALQALRTLPDQPEG